MTTKIPVELSSTPGISDSSNATAITIDSDERIIIGHTTALDDIRATDPYLQVLGSGLDTAHIGVIRFSDSVNGGHISIGKSRSGTVGTNTIVQDGDKIGSLNFVGGDGTDYHEGAVIEAVISGTPGTGDLPTALTFQTTADGANASTEAMRILPDGKVGIGKTDPNYPLVVAGTNPKIQIYDSAGSGQTNLYFGDSGSNLAGYVIYQHSDNKMRLGTNATDRMTISSAGRVTTFSDSGTATLSLACATTGDTESAIRYHRNSSISHDGDVRFVVFSSGNVQNINNSYAAISDIKLKENIVDATDKLSDIKQVKVRNYNFIGETKKQLGVIAQELEAIFPNMVEDIPDTDAEDNDLGTTTKSVKYSIFVPMLIKAMQEQQTQIEALQSEINTLKGG